MRNVWVLLLTLTISTLFIHVPHKGELGFLLNKKVTLSYNQYFWMICQHLQLIALAGVIWDESRHWYGRTEKEREMLTRLYNVYLWILIADLALWFLFYDDPLKDYRITWNILKTVIFMGSIAIEKWKHGSA